MTWGYVAVGAGTLIAGALQSNSASKASSQQAKGADAASQMQLSMYNQSRADAEPWRRAGQQGLSALSADMGLSGYGPGADRPLSFEQWSIDNNKPEEALLTGGGSKKTKAFRELQNKALTMRNLALRSEYDTYFKDFKPAEKPAAGGDKPYFHDFGMEDFTADPGAEFRRTEGMRGVEGSASARGGILSGAALKNINRYNQDYASGEYSNAYNRFNNDRTNRFNRLSGIAGTGQQVNAQNSALGANVATQVGSNAMEAANARSAGTIARGNAINSGIQTIGNLYQEWQASRPPNTPAVPNPSGPRQ